MTLRSSTAPICLMEGARISDAGTEYVHVQHIPGGYLFRGTDRAQDLVQFSYAELQRLNTEGSLRIDPVRTPWGKSRKTLSLPPRTVDPEVIDEFATRYLSPHRPTYSFVHLLLTAYIDDLNANLPDGAAEFRVPCVSTLRRRIHKLFSAREVARYRSGRADTHH